jgi:MFS transporter, DHA3 family, macrolide efflux protein
MGLELFSTMAGAVLVSAFGDIAYSLALGFWIYAKTGSTALMGTLMAVSMLPRIIISPFAGVWVDRSDRKKIIVWMDFIRGVLVVLVGIAAFTDTIEIWMVFAAGIILGVCAAFFNPAVSSAITFCFFIPFIFMPSFKRFINYNPDEQSLEDIMQ